MTPGTLRRSRRLAGALALSLLLVLVAAACGGGNGDGDAGDVPTVPIETGPPEDYTATDFEPTLSFQVPPDWELVEPQPQFVQVFQGGTQERGVSFDGSRPGQPVDAVVEQLRTTPGVEATETSPTTIGGASGQMFETTVDEAEFEGYAYFPFRGLRLQVHVVDVDGQTVVIFVDAPEEQAEDFFPLAQDFLQTVEFGGAGGG